MDRYVPIESHSAIFGMVALERASDLATLSLFLFIGAIFFPGSGVDTALYLGASIFVVVAIGVALGALPTTRLKLLGVAPSSVRNIAGNVLFGSQYLTAESTLQLASYAVLRWSVAVLAFLPLAAAIDVRIEMSVALVTVCLMSLVTAIPLTPGGIGPAETAGTGTLVLSGLPLAEALSLVVLQRSVVLVGMGITGILIYNYSELVAGKEGS